MISLNEEHQLGLKAFILLLLRHVILGFVLFVVAVIIYTMRDFLVGKVLEAIQTLGSTTPPSIQSLLLYFGNAINILFLFSILLMLIGFLISLIEYHFYTFRFDEFDLHMKKGFLYRKEIAIPYRQMQDINIFRNLFYQILGLSRVIIDSAGQEEKHEHNQTEIILEPLDKVEAEEIRDFLERRIGIQIVVDQKIADRENEETMKVAEV